MSPEERVGVGISPRLMEVLGLTEEEVEGMGLEVAEGEPREVMLLTPEELDHLRERGVEVTTLPPGEFLAPPAGRILRDVLERVNSLIEWKRKRMKPLEGPIIIAIALLTFVRGEIASVLAIMKDP